MWPSGSHLTDPVLTASVLGSEETSHPPPRLTTNCTLAVRRLVSEVDLRPLGRKESGLGGYDGEIVGGPRFVLGS
jgi:hypothetical protein